VRREEEHMTQRDLESEKQLRGGGEEEDEQVEMR
jgi:hypothetical protein